MLFVFMFSIAIMLLIEWKVSKSLINIFSMFAVPYFLIIPLNNLFIADYLGFYKISNQVMKMLLLGLTSIFVGCLVIGISNSRRIQNVKLADDADALFERYNVRKMGRLILLIEFIMLIRAVRIYLQSGIGGFSNTDGSYLSGGLGHLYLMIFPLLPVILLKWLTDKKEKIYLFIYLIGVLISALSFVKYNVISLIIITYVFVCIHKKDYILKGAILMGGLIVAFFVGNYILGFIANNMLGEVNRVFYLNHLWMYISGSLIHDNMIFDFGLNQNCGMLYKIIYCLSPIPNMFYKLVTGNTFSFDINVPLEVLGRNGEAGNVIDFIGFMYSSGFKNQILDNISFLLFWFVMGSLFSILFYKGINRQGNIRITICIVITFFCILSFFGVYASLSTTWEILIWSMIIPNFFNGRIVFGRK